MSTEARKEQEPKERRRVGVHDHEEDARFTPAGTLVRQAVGLRDARRLRRYLESSTGNRAFVTSASVDARRGWRVCLLHLAAFEGSMDTVLLLLGEGASVNAQDLDGWTPLHHAARNGVDAETLVRTLVVAGAEIDKPDNRGRTALHVAYLCRNFRAAAELLAQGASPAARDIHRRTPMQLLKQHAPVGCRPWSGSAAAVARRSRDGVVVDLRQTSARRDRPFTASPPGGRPRDVLSRRESHTTAGSTEFARFEETMGSPSTSDPSSANVDECGAPASCFSLEEGTEIWQDPPAPNEAPPDDDTSLFSPSTPKRRSKVSDLHGEGPADACGANIPGPIHAERSFETTVIPTECCRCGRAISDTGKDPFSRQSEASDIRRNEELHNDKGNDNDDGQPRREDDTIVAEDGEEKQNNNQHASNHNNNNNNDDDDDDDNDAPSFSGHPRPATSQAARGQPQRVRRDPQPRGTLSPPLMLRSSISSDPARAARSRSAATAEAKRHHRGMSAGSNDRGNRHEGVAGSTSPPINRTSRGGAGDGRARSSVRETSGTGLDNLRTNIIPSRPSWRFGRGRWPLQRRQQRGATAGHQTKKKRKRSKGNSCREGRRFVPPIPQNPGDEVPDYVAGERRWKWAKNSAKSAAERDAKARQRREECRSPRILKLEAITRSNAEAEERKRERDRRKRSRPRPPGGWGGGDGGCGNRSGSPDASPTSRPRPVSSPAAFRSRSASASSGSPYGGRCCIKCDYSDRWDDRGEFLGGWGDLVAGRGDNAVRGGATANGGDGGRNGDCCLHGTVAESFRMARLWRRSPTDKSELWWAKGRHLRAGSTVVLKTQGKEDDDDSDSVDDDGQKGARTRFVREWGVLKYLQEEGWAGARQPLSVRLISAFEPERTLVLSAPATSRTLREIGQMLHAGITNRRTRTSGGESEQRLAAEFHEQVELLASQACGAVCWLHRCGLISGDVTPCNFVSPGGGAAQRGERECKNGRADRRMRSSTRDNLRLLTARSVARRPAEEGGCPKHPLLQLVGLSFPPGQPFDPVYASPERLKAASEDLAYPASIAEDAWGLGMTLVWLLTGRDQISGNVVTGHEVNRLITIEVKTAGIAASTETVNRGKIDPGGGHVSSSELVPSSFQSLALTSSEAPAASEGIDAGLPLGGRRSVFSLLPGLLSRDPAERRKTLAAAESMVSAAAAAMYPSFPSNTRSPPSLSPSTRSHMLHSTRNNSNCPSAHHCYRYSRRRHRRRRVQSASPASVRLAAHSGDAPDKQGGNSAGGSPTTKTAFESPRDGEKRLQTDCDEDRAKSGGDGRGNCCSGVKIEDEVDGKNTDQDDDDGDEDNIDDDKGKAAGVAASPHVSEDAREAINDSNVNNKSTEDPSIKTPSAGDDGQAARVSPRNSHGSGPLPAQPAAAAQGRWISRGRVAGLYVPHLRKTQQSAQENVAATATVTMVGVSTKASSVSPKHDSYCDDEPTPKSVSGGEEAGQKGNEEAVEQNIDLTSERQLPVAGDPESTWGAVDVSKTAKEKERGMPEMSQRTPPKRSSDTSIVNSQAVVEAEDGSKSSELAERAKPCERVHRSGASDDGASDGRAATRPATKPLKTNHHAVADNPSPDSTRLLNKNKKKSNSRRRVTPLSAVKVRDNYSSSDGTCSTASGSDDGGQSGAGSNTTTQTDDMCDTQTPKDVRSRGTIKGNGGGGVIGAGVGGCRKAASKVDSVTQYSPRGRASEAGVVTLVSDIAAAGQEQPRMIFDRGECRCSLM